MAAPSLPRSTSQVGTPCDWEMISVKDEPEDDMTVSEEVTDILDPENIKVETSATTALGSGLVEGQQCLGELHYVNKPSVRRGQVNRGQELTRSEVGLLSFKPFKVEDQDAEEREVYQDLSYLDETRLCMSPRDHEIDPEFRENESAPLTSHNECRKSQSSFNVRGTSKELSTARAGLTYSKSDIPSSVNNSREFNVLLRGKNDQYFEKGVSKGSAKYVVPEGVSDVKDCVVELCKKSSCGVDCKCFGRVPSDMQKKQNQCAAPEKATRKAPSPDLLKLAADTSRRTVDGKRQMKMSEKLRAFYEERQRIKLAQMKKACMQASRPAESLSLHPVSSVSSKTTTSPKPGSLPDKPRRIRKSRRLEESLYCPFCSKEFHYTFSLRRHVKAHTLKGENMPPPHLEREDVAPSHVETSVSRENAISDVLTYENGQGSEYTHVVGIEPEENEYEDPPHLDPEITPPSSYTQIRALLTTHTVETGPAVQKPGRVVLNVPKIDLSRRQKALAKEKTGPKHEDVLPTPAEETVNRSRRMSVEETIVNRDPTVERERTETSIRPDGDGELNVSREVNVTDMIHPSCNPVVVIAPIEDVNSAPMIEVPQTEALLSHERGHDVTPVEEQAVSPAWPNSARVTSQKDSIISTLDKATHEIFTFLSMAEASVNDQTLKPAEAQVRDEEFPVIEVSPVAEGASLSTNNTMEEEELLPDPLNDSGITEEDAEEVDVDTEENVTNVNKPRKNMRKRWSAVSLGLSSQSKMKSVKSRKKRKASRRHQLKKSIKTIVNSKNMKGVPTNSRFLGIADRGIERRSRKRKSTHLPVKQNKSGNGPRNEVKRPRTDSDSGIDTESDGSDRAKRSPQAKQKESLVDTETTDESVTIHLMSGEPISKQELHARVDDQIAKRTQSEPVVCPICEKKFSYPSEIKRHIMMHTNERAFKCALCNKAFARRPHLNEHMRVHTGERPFKCKSCPAAFAQKSNLMIHTRTHTGARPFSCSECGKRFRRQDAQNQHLLTHHSNVKPYTCAECGAAFPCLRYLKDHMKCHSKERPYKCQQCDAAFVCNKYLKLHIRALHTNVRPYKCDMCPAKFTQSGKLIEHQRIHTGERPYSCSSCGASFVRSGHLRRHLLTHTGERPYGCTECQARFSQRDHLKRHIKTMH